MGCSTMPTKLFPLKYPVYFEKKQNLFSEDKRKKIIMKNLNKTNDDNDANGKGEQET